MHTDPRLTGFGWLVRLPNGELIEVATDQEALEIQSEEEDDEEE